MEVGSQLWWLLASLSSGGRHVGLWWRWWLSSPSFSLAGAVVVAVIAVIWEGGGCLRCCSQWAVEAW